MGGGWKYHPSLPSRPFLPLGLLKKPLQPASPGVPESSLFLPLALFHDVRELQPQSTPLLLPSLQLPAIYPPPEYPPPSRPRIPENTPPSPDSVSLHLPTPGCPTPKSALLRRPRPPPVPRSKRRVRSPSRRERADASSAPRPSAPSRPEFWLHARLPKSCSGLREQVRAAAARRSPARLPGREGGGVVVEGGRRGRGSSALGSATLPLRANPSPLSPSPMPRPPLSSGGGYAQTVPGPNLSALA